MGKKKKKKEKILEGTPIETIPYFMKEKEDLVLHAIKVAEELNAMRLQRENMEDDRDSMTHYYSNAVYQLANLEREIRRAERQLIHKQGTAQDEGGKKIDLKPFIKMEKEREGYAIFALDKYREVFKGEEEMRSDRLRERKEAWERILDKEVAVMKVSHRARWREIGKIGEVYTSAILQEERTAAEAQERLFDRLDEAADQDFRRLVLLKNKQVHDMQRGHQRKVEEMKACYEELMQSDITLRYRKEAVKLTEETNNLLHKLSEYKKFYVEHKTVMDSAQKQARDLIEIETNRASMESEVALKKHQLNSMEETNYNLKLETDFIAEYDKNCKDQLKILWRDCFSEVKRTRLKHLRICHAMDTLRKALQKELSENMELLNRYRGQKNNLIEELQRIFIRRRAEKETIGDLAERVLGEYGLHVVDLDLPEAYAERLAADRPSPPERERPTRVPIGRETAGVRRAWDPRWYGLTTAPAFVRRRTRT